MCLAAHFGGGSLPHIPRTSLTLWYFDWMGDGYPLFLSLVLSTPQGLSVPHEHVLPVFGYETGCRVETEQLSMPEECLTVG